MYILKLTLRFAANKTYPTPIRWMLFIEHYQGDSGYIWVPPVRAFRHSTFGLVASAPFYIISWSPLSHESEVPAYIKKRQVPFFGLGRIRAMLGAVVLTCYLLCSNQRCECEIGKDQHGVLFLSCYGVLFAIKGSILECQSLETLSKTFDCSIETYGL